MNFPVEIGIGNFKLSAHLLFESLAFFIGYRYYIYSRGNTQDTISTDNRVWLIIGAAFGAFLFSRLIGSLENPQAWWQTAHPLLYFFQNKTIVGGLFGGLLGVELMKLFIKEKHSSGDLFTPPLILAMMIGRIGCFSSGVYEETYGIETMLPFGMNLGDGLLRHPVTLYEIAFLGLLWSILTWIKQHYRLKNGYLFKFFMINYFIFRFFLEFIKPSVRLDIGLTTIQITCLAVLFYYRHTLFNLVFKPHKLLHEQQ